MSNPASLNFKVFLHCSLTWTSPLLLSSLLSSLQSASLSSLTLMTPDQLEAICEAIARPTSRLETLQLSNHPAFQPPIELEAVAAGTLAAAVASLRLLRLKNVPVTEEQLREVQKVARGSICSSHTHL